MSLRINDVAPDFTAETTEGPISFHQWIGDGWAILFSHPKDFTPVCTTELGTVAGLKSEFERRNCRVLGISVDGGQRPPALVEGHRGLPGPCPELPARGRPGAADREGLRHAAGRRRRHVGGAHAADNATARSVFVIGPDKRIKATLTYPMSTGRNFDEILRLLDSCQLTATKKVATPANWSQGQDVIILPAVSDAEAREKYPDGWQAPLPYIRIVPQPK